MPNYLFQPRGKGTGYLFRLAVPKDLRGRIPDKNGRIPDKPITHIVEGLKTKRLPEAQSKAAVLWQRWDDAFKRERRGTPLSGQEIEQAAWDEYHALLDHMTVMPLEKAALDGAIEQTQEALDDEEWEAAARPIAAVERKYGVRVEQGTPTYAALAKALLTAQLEAFQGRWRKDQGQPSITPVAFTAEGIDPQTLQPVGFRRPRMARRDGPGFTEVGETFLAEMARKSGKERTASTRRRYQTAFRLFADYSHDAPLVAVDRKLASGFLDTVAKLDPRWGQHHKAKGLPLSALLKKFGRGQGQLSNAALNHYTSTLKSLFDWARKRGDFDAENPFALQSRETADSGWQPYTPDELKTLLGSLEGQMRSIAMVALYSGMRLEEICQLQREDVKREAGVLYFDLHAGHRLKTRAAIRRVPVHSRLIEANIIKAGQGKGPLWSELKRSGPDGKLSVYISKRFTVFRRRAGVNRPRLSFHSLRKNFVTALNQAGVHQADIAAVVGHAQGFTLDTYSGGPGLKRLRDVVEKVKYAGLKL